MEDYFQNDDGDEIHDGNHIENDENDIHHDDDESY